MDTYRKRFYYLVATNLIIRLLVALTTNLGIDEAYYFSYALFPDWSYFDHPPLVGQMIIWFSFSLAVISDLFLRLGPLVIGTVNLFIIFKIGVLIKNNKVGFIASLLYSASFYCSIIVGVFVMPDAPQSVFWLASMYVFLKYMSSQKNGWLVLFGLFTGLAMLAKYHAAFLGVGVGLYILFHNRQQLKNPYLYLSAFISLALFLPVILWNYFAEYSSFAFHGQRVGSESMQLTLKYFFPEFFGQVFYNNPINWVIIVSSTIFIFRNKLFKTNEQIKYLFYTGIPIIATLLVMALFNRTFPHWSGPGYYALILIASVVVEHKTRGVSKPFPTKGVLASSLLFGFIVVVGVLQINFGIIPMPQEENQKRLGKNDVTLDLYGWEQAGERFEELLKEDQLLGQGNTFIITHNWFPACQVDLYMAYPNNIDLYVTGSIFKQHHYRAVNHKRGAIQQADEGYYITTSRYFQEPDETITSQFETISQPKIIPIKRGRRTVAYIYVYRLQNLVNTEFQFKE